MEVPHAVAEIAGDDAVTPVWRNQLGGLTFRLEGANGGIRYVKWVAAGTPEIDLLGEAERLEWAGRWIAVPRVLAHGSDARGAWLVTAALPGRSAVDPRWTADPATAAAAIGRGLRLLHDTLPVRECPFDWGVERRLRGRGEAGRRLGEPPAVDRLVVCHGDACAPNTLLHDDGTFAGHVDLGSLGVADRWADLAVAAWSTEWNYGPGYDGVVYDAYGVAPDPERIAFYRSLWDAT
ncbi:putative phosphotransferase [Microbispora rosea subsp. aerata]|nr:aminoglycoside 3'-phosphotransferase [Microbispora rosea]GGO29986.1 putative phosphotransferase [Microbispora rosea subsp. aerata]GIH59070.1 putative phosphotransferase [Microbispora rosea subsp. aerata]GLJ83621.1 putative phosphotransferase [Microbispora rosea subsp. aerata]